MKNCKAEAIADFQGKDTKDSPENGILEADVAVHVPFFIGIVPPFAMANAFQRVTGQPLGCGSDNHTAKEQKDGA